MLDTLSAENPTISWNCNYNGNEFQMTFNVNGTGNIGKTVFHYSIGPSGNPEFPLAFIAQAPHPVAQQVNQIWSGMVGGANGGGGFLTDGWPGGQAGTLSTFSMVLVQ